MRPLHLHAPSRCPAAKEPVSPASSARRAGLSRRGFLGAAAAAAGAALSGCNGNGFRTLYILDWAHYIPVSMLQAFERENNVRIRYQAYGSNQQMLDELHNGSLPWDLAFPCQQYLPRMKSEDMLLPLERKRLPNIRNLGSEFQEPFWDPQLEYSVPVSWGCTGIAYSRQIQMKITCWADLWDERLRERMTMLNDRDEVLAATLLKLGYPLNSAEPEHLEQAKREAILQKRLISRYGNLESKDRLVSGEYQVAQLWSNLAGQAINASPNINFVFPEAGFPLYAENAVVLKTSQNVDLAHAFIDFLLMPEVSAHLSENAYTASTVPESRRFLPLRLREDRLLFPPADVIARGQWFQPQTPEARARRQKVWEEILAA